MRDHERQHIRNIHGLDVTHVVGFPAFGITDIAVVSSAMVGTVLEDGAAQGSGAGENRSNRRSSIIIVCMFLGELRKDGRLG